MVRRGRAITLTVASVVAFLFVGRRLSVILSDYWFGNLVSPEAGTFLLQFHLLRAILDGAGVLVAGTWFIGNLFVVYRALGSVQVPRFLANIEFRETLTPNVLLGIAVAQHSPRAAARRQQCSALVWIQEICRPMMCACGAYDTQAGVGMTRSP